MKLILLFLCLISCSYCIQIVSVDRNQRIMLSTATSEDKYFFFTNSNFIIYTSKYIYFCLEDSFFELNYNNIKYCQTSSYPSSSPESFINSCYFISISYYNHQSSSNKYEYYYKIPNDNFYIHTIVYYQGKLCNGDLYVTADYNDLAPDVQITKILRNSKALLPTKTSEIKYFYLTNSEYYSHSSFIYFYLEDKSFGLSYDNIRYCGTNINPSSSPDSAINGFSFSTISYYTYTYQSSSSTYKYYYRISTNKSYAYSIVYYQGSYSYGNLYVFTDYYDLNKDV